MNEDESIRKFFLRVDELGNAMRTLGEKISDDDTFLVQKILRSLPDRMANLDKQSTTINR